MPVGTVQLVTMAEYARMRGCSEGGVRRAVRDKRISLIDGKIDPVAADAQWQRNTRVRMGSMPALDVAAGRPRVPDGNAPRADADADGDNSYWAAKSRREKADAEMAELKLAEQRGDMVRSADVRAGQAKRLAALRESLLQLPARLAPVLAVESDPARCHDALQAELRAVLEQMTAAPAAAQP